MITCFAMLSTRISRKALFRLISRFLLNKGDVTLRLLVFWRRAFFSRLGIHLSRTKKFSTNEKQKSCNKEHENPITDQCLIIHDTSEHTVNTSLFSLICFQLWQKVLSSRKNKSLKKSDLFFCKIDKRLSRSYLTLAIDKIL